LQGQGFAPSAIIFASMMVGNVGLSSRRGFG
jgi:hypothetical protein